MAFPDATLFFSGKSGTHQAVTATALSEDVIHNLFGTPATIHNQPAAVNTDVEPGQIPIVIQVTQAFATLTSLTVTLESDSAAAMNVSPTIHWSSGAIGVASLILGYRFAIDYLPGGRYGEYLACRYTVGGSNATTGKLYAAIHDRATTNLWE